MCHEKYMRLALDLALKAQGMTRPNPLVGAVIVKDGHVVGTGYHRKAGGPHAEVFALCEAGSKARGGTIYTNLEPCSHQGRTPPCAGQIIDAGLSRVVSAMEDPNPRVAGRGFDLLRKAGVEVSVGVLAGEARKVNEAFCKYITRGVPFVALKTATTLDGKVATTTGMSRWITGEESRHFVHQLRQYYDAILTGAGTVLKDDPRLNVRLTDKGQDPIRVVVDSRGRIPLEAKVFILPAKDPTILAVTTEAPPEKIARLQEMGVQVLVLPAKEGRVDLHALLKELGKREITSLLVEAGGTLNYSLLADGLVDKAYIFLAPLIFGGQSAPTSVDGQGIEDIAHAWRLEDMGIDKYGEDILLTGYIKGGARDVYRVD